MNASITALNNAVQDTLETLAFTEAVPLAADRVRPLPAPFYVTTVEVKQPYAGSIRLMIGRELAISLVSSMLGGSDPMDDATVQDGLSELVNTISGRILAQLVDNSSSFDLGIPQTIFMETARPRGSDVLVRQTYALNEGSIELELAFKKAQAA
ncbi:MAG: chemotaxis protein CheX [Pseudobdellovibrionaceae bacterium]|nr:chemotaxis protein CheX [Pseudobdellovibrionaceae bacterium]